MTEIKKDKKVLRRIVLIYDFSISANNALNFALKMCEVMKSELAILNVFNEKLNNVVSENKLNLQAKIEELKSNFSFEIEGFVIEGDVQKIFKAFYEKYEGIMIVLGISGKDFTNDISFKKFLKMVRQSKIPWLTVPEKAEIGDFSKVVLPVSYTRQNKEKIAWASYFYRLNKSVIFALTASAKDGFIKIGVKNNVLFLKKMYKTLDVEFEIISTEKNIHDIDNYSIEFASTQNAGLVIALVSTRPDIFDLLFGPNERKLIINKKNLPVLSINPLDDMYIICN